MLILLSLILLIQSKSHFITILVFVLMFHRSYYINIKFII